MTTGASVAVPGRGELWDLYRIAIDEYRFEVRLNADRAQHYLVLNAGIFAAGAGILRLGAVAWAVIPVFVLGFATSLLAISTVQRGRSYYYRTREKLFLVEDALGLNVPLRSNDPDSVLALTTTDAMLSRAQGRSTPPRVWWDMASWNVTTTLIVVYAFFAAANAVLVVLALLHPPT